MSVVPPEGDHKEGQAEPEPEEEGGVALQLPSLELETWHHGRHMDKVSSHLAYAIVGLFIFVLGGPLVAIVFHWATQPELDGYSKVAIPTVSGIVGSVVGFYFRAQKDL